MRIDTELVRRGIYVSRTRAVRAISEGLVFADGKIVTKPSFDVNEKTVIEAKEDPVPYVSRGALKLKGTLEHFNISPKGHVCIDIGASTGGFTQILLEGGASSVTCVDVGHGQLAKEIKNDLRVTAMEGFDARKIVEEEEMKEHFTLASIDVSFISLEKILPAAAFALKKDGLCICLIKPQFEAGRKFLNKKGIVTSEKVRQEVLERFGAYASIFFYTGEIIESPIEGGDGNIEYLTLLKKR
ncbi:MAG: TlyA family RNA methyltransferase [Clostridia bacterium]|nr:TlyA family RNA methyltransferase [Clostridia bacterium]